LLKVAEQTIVDLNLADTEALAEWRRDAAGTGGSGNFYRAKEAAPEGDKEHWCAISTRDLVDYRE